MAPRRARELWGYKGGASWGCLWLFPLAWCPRESLQLQRGLLGVYFPAGMWPWISEKEENIYSRSVWPACSRGIKPVLLLQLLVLHPHGFKPFQGWALHHCPAQCWATLSVWNLFLISFSAIQFKYSKG